MCSNVIIARRYAATEETFPKTKMYGILEIREYKDGYQDSVLTNFLLRTFEEAQQKARELNDLQRL